MWLLLAGKILASRQLRAMGAASSPHVEEGQRHVTVASLRERISAFDDAFNEETWAAAREEMSSVLPRKGKGR